LGRFLLTITIYYLPLTSYHKDMILGIDEVGRGPWAGPLVVGAVVLGDVGIEGLTDSKKLSKKRREELSVLIYERAKGIGLGWVQADEIDTVGLSEALRLATRRAVEQVHAPYHEIIIDGTINFLADTTKSQYVTTMKKADLLIPSVSAASIVAKVARDAYMAEQDTAYPGYGFAAHVGYGTAAHSKAIDALGVTPLHRLSFAPLAKYRSSAVRHVAKEGLSAEQHPKGEHTSTTRQIGDDGEDAATTYITQRGHQVVERNWKTKFCEIDIVSLYNETVYFVEVKYRKDAQQGGGMAAITPKKLRQMKFAAEYYALKNNLVRTNLRLAAISVSGMPPIVEEYLEVL
jgi:ribonuclease HII